MTLAEAFQALSDAFTAFIAALGVAGIEEAPDLASIGYEISELPGNITNCVVLAVDLGLVP